MPQITSITMKNLRGLQNLTLEDTRTFNLIVGPSDIGKTTLLESVFMGATIYMPGLLDINRFRNAPLSGYNNVREAINTLFKNASEEKFAIATTLKNPRLNMTYQFDQIFSKNPRPPATDINITPNNNTDTTNGGNAYRIHANIAITGDLQGHIERELIIGDTQVSDRPIASTLTKTSDQSRIDDLDPYVAASAMIITTPPMVTASMHHIALHKKKPILLDLLSKINPAIRGIDIGGGQNVYIDIGLPQLIPIHTAGESVKRTLVSMGQLYGTDTDILLEDDIGNGIYHTSLPSYLRAILRTAKDQNKQIFATTHNKDVLVALQQVAEQESDLQSDIKCYAMGRNIENQVVASPFTYKGLAHCIKYDIEIR